MAAEEFVVVCEEPDARGAELLAERIRSELTATIFQFGTGSFRVSCSIGIASCTTAGRRWELLLKGAHDVLYASKRGGRNARRFGAASGRTRLRESSRAWSAASGSFC